MLHSYCRFLDLNQPDLAANLFTEDCTANYRRGATRSDASDFRLRGPLRGRVEVAAYLTAAMNRFAATSHHLSNVEMEFEGPDRVQSTAYLLAWHRSPLDNAADFTMYGRYHDVLIRTDAGWRIADRRLRSAGITSITSGNLDANERFEDLGRRH